MSATATTTGFTFYDILRDAALGKLGHCDTQRLRDYQTLIQLRIEAKTEALTRPNMLGNERADLLDDIRWYESISRTIGGMLTAEYHQK